jgi:crotonobetainyl-CoA:carnitine CoA-transferase CaiB-like acyl-CoA transferase
VPRIGQHTSDILRELGHEAADIRRMLDEAVVFEPQVRAAQ